MNLGFRLSFTKVIFFDAGFPKHYLTMSHLPSCVCPRSTGMGGHGKHGSGGGIKALKGSAASLSSAEWFSKETLPKCWGSTVGHKAALPRRDQSSSSSHLLLPQLGCFLPPVQQPQPPPSPSLPFIHLTLNEWHT